MSKVTLKTPTQLRKFLQVLAEEAVGQARAGMDGKAQQQQIATDIQKSKKSFMREEDPPEASDNPAPPPADDKTPAPKPTVESEIVPKYDSLVDAINTLRGAGSTRDSTVERQLRGYFDKLDPAEAASAIVMLRSFADVMRGDVPGTQAPDPSDFNITMTMKKSGETAPAPAPAAAPPEPAPAPTESESEPDEENTSPPIKVNSGEQVSEAYRAKIRQLMSKR